MGMWAGILLIVIVVLAIGVYSAKKTKSAGDFLTNGGSAGAVTMAAAILSTVVGGSMTVGSAEMGFKEGMFGAWQSVGSSIAMILLSIILCNFFMKARENYNITTIPGTLTHAYGKKIGILLGITGFIGVFLSVLAQIKSFMVLLQNITAMTTIFACVATGILFITYAAIGGMKSASAGGAVKVIGLYILLVACMVYILTHDGGWVGMVTAAAAQFENSNFMSVLSRGVGSSLGYGLSFSFGFICTQVYIQCLLSCKNPTAARNGCIIGCIGCLPLGVVCAIVGIYMRGNYPEIEAANALPMFISNSFPATVTGLFMGIMLLNTLTSGGGLALSCATNIYQDVIRPFLKNRTDKQHVTGLRLSLAAVVILGCVLTMTNAGAAIMTFVNLSAQLRACTLLVPTLFLVYYRGRKAWEAGWAAVIVGGAGDVVWYLMGNPFGFNSLYFGLLASLAAYLAANAIFAKKYQPLDMTAYGYKFVEKTVG